MERDYDYDELYPGRFLHAGEFKDKAVTLTIVAVDLEEMADKKGKNGLKKKPILTFTTPGGRPVEKQLVLCKTNGGCIAGMFKDPATGKMKTSQWIGKRVTFYPEIVNAFGSKKPAIRVLGSPDIPHDMTFSYQLGQEVATVTMKKTVLGGRGPAVAAAPPPPPEPEPTSSESTDQFLDELEGSSANGQ